MNKKTALYQEHIKLSGKMVPFAGYEMPIQYPDGIVKEHDWVRSSTGLFDVSHMGQVIVEGATAGDFFSKITPSNFVNAKIGVSKYTVLTNESGGIIDDLIITRFAEDKFFAVINAGCKEKDIAWMKKNLPSNLKFTELAERSLIALQGTKAEEVLNSILKHNFSALEYMRFTEASFEGEKIYIFRLGYTGEDGFEISVPSNQAANLWNKILENKNVKPIGLGARDSLRLEMGYPLYGHDIDDTTSPIEATLGWVISKGHTNFIGAERVLKEKTSGAARKRVGIKLLDKGVAREGSEILKDGKIIGKLTSGSYSPTLKESIGQGYVESQFANQQNSITVKVRDREIAAEITAINFLKPRTKTVKKEAA